MTTIGLPNGAASMHRQRRAAYAAAWGAFGLLLVASIVASALGLRINRTPSLPFGLYATSNAANAPMVTFCAPTLATGDSVYDRGYVTAGLCPDGGSPLLKPVVARAGDQVKLGAKGIEVNGQLLINTAALARDRNQLVLTPYPFGQYTVQPGTVWVASSFHPGSIDSRYLGPIPVELIREKIAPLWTTATHPQ